MNSTSQSMLADVTKHPDGKVDHIGKLDQGSHHLASIAKNIKLSQLPSQKLQREQILALTKLSSVPHSTLQASVPAGIFEHSELRLGTSLFLSPSLFY